MTAMPEARGRRSLMIRPIQTKETPMTNAPALDAIARAVSDVVLGKVTTPGTIAPTAPTTMTAKKAGGHFAELFALRRLDPEIDRKVGLLLALAEDRPHDDRWSDEEMLNEALSHVSTAPLEHRLVNEDVRRARAGDPDGAFAERILQGLTVASPEPAALTVAMAYLEARNFELAPAPSPKGEETAPAS